MMDLFTDFGSNLLPCDGEVNYYGRIVPAANEYLARLLTEIPWKHDQVSIGGQARLTKRQVAWFGDRHYAYTYSGVTRQAMLWCPLLLELRQIVEEKLDRRFNSCLLNLYADGSEGMAWHSDDEAELGVNTTIASLSLGAERRFLLKHKQTRQLVTVWLEHGSLLVMKGETQTHWLHSLPVTARVNTPRVNLTFRTILTT